MALLFLGIFVLLILGLGFFLSRRPDAFRPRHIAAYRTLIERTRLAVEEGRQVHISLGRGGLADPSSPAALVGLSMAEQLTRITAAGDRPPLVSSGDGALMLVSQDSQRAVYREIGAEDHFDPLRAQLTGLTPFSYAAGIEPLARDKQVALHLLAGHTGSEVALITEAVEREEGIAVAGSVSLPAQAILYATAQEPLIGEELYAGGAFLGAGPLHLSSLWAEDVMRLVLILVILAGAVLKLLGVL